MIDILTRVCRRINESRELEKLRKKEQIQRVMRAFEMTTTRLINAIPLPTILLDEEDRILLANPQFIKLFDLEEVGLLSERIETGECFLPDLVCQRPEHFPACRAGWKEMAYGLCQDDECLIGLKGGDEINYQLRLGELVDEEGNMRYLVCFIPS